ncbi:MAG: efflux RND transporter periplasmic adaptor subunit [Syntrophobacteraceae bacterium]
MFSPAGRKIAGGVAQVGASLILFAGMFALMGLASCSGGNADKAKAEAKRANPPVPVTVAEAVVKDVPMELTAIGNVEAYNTVQIKAQVSGELTTVHFEEGQNVKMGDMLFTIDPRPYEARLKQAEANLAKEKAQLEYARKQVDRYGSVVQKGYVSQEQFDQIRSNAAALDASIQADEAAIENAKLELKYCYIRSPINGVAGDIGVDQGNVIKANDDKALVTIMQVTPIYITFSVPEKDLPEVRKHMAAEGRLPVRTTTPGGDRPVTGDLMFVDNTVDPATGTIKLKAVYGNQERTLWPGQFVNVILTLAMEKNALVVPSQTVQTGQQGPYVFVVKPDSTVEYRPVTVGQTVENEIVITKGVAPGEKVVTDGQLRLTQGSVAKVVQEGGDSAGGKEPRS